MKNNPPLISCLCLTKNRPDCLLRSIKCYISQTYTNKELLVIYHHYDSETKKVLQLFKRNDIIGIQLRPIQMSLGEIRNLSISKCKGEYFCQWDDDDWYHNDRLEIQVDHITKSYKEASVLFNWLMYDYNNNQAYLSFKAAWSGSILCKKSLFTNGIKYPPVNKHEDLYFIIKLFKQNCLFPIINPILYIKTFHGRNVFKFSYFENICINSQKLSTEFSLLIRHILDSKFSNDEASALLLQKEIQQEINYFYFPKLTKKKLFRQLVYRILQSARNGFIENYY